MSGDSVGYIFVVIKQGPQHRLTEMWKVFENAPFLGKIRVAPYFDPAKETAVFQIEHRASETELATFRTWALGQGFEFRDAASWTLEVYKEFVAQLRPFHCRYGTTARHHVVKELAGQLVAVCRVPPMQWESEGTFRFRSPFAEPRTSEAAPAQHGAILNQSGAMDEEEWTAYADESEQVVTRPSIEVSKSMRLDLRKLLEDEEFADATSIEDILRSKPES